MHVQETSIPPMICPALMTVDFWSMQCMSVWFQQVIHDHDSALNLSELILRKVANRQQKPQGVFKEASVAAADGQGSERFALDEGL